MPRRAHYAEDENMLGLPVKPGTLEGMKGVPQPVDSHKAVQPSDSQSSFRSMLDAVVSSPVEIEQTRTRDDAMSDSTRQAERREAVSEPERQPRREQAEGAARDRKPEAAQEKNDKKDVREVPRPEAKTQEKKADHAEKLESMVRGQVAREAAERTKTGIAPTAEKPDPAVRAKNRKKNEESRPLDHLMHRLDQALRAASDSLKEMKGVGEPLHDVRDALKGKSRGTDTPDALHRRLRDFAKRLEHAREDAASPRDKAQLRALAQQSHELAEALAPRARRQDKHGTTARAFDHERADAKERAGERTAALPVHAREEARDAQHSRGGGQHAQSGLQFGRAEQGAARHAQHASAPQRAALFDDQLQQLMQGAKMSVRDNQNATLSLRLHPESLGRMSVNLGLEGGTLVGRFLVENTDAKNALVEQLASVRNELAEAGIAVGEFQVDVRGQDPRSAGERAYEQPAYIHRAGQESVAGSYEGNAARAHYGAIDVVA
jgi:flagellar hook-length control protein FliK